MFDDRFDLTQAVLEGRKTMTRRMVPARVLFKVLDYQRQYHEMTLDAISTEQAIENMVGPERMFHCAFQPGEIVAVAQSYHSILKEMFAKDKGYQNPIYNPFRAQKPNLEEEAGWNNKMFVKAGLMPHQIRITNVRVERLQGISDRDSMREGVREDFAGFQYSFDSNIGYCGQYPFGTPREAFAALLDKVSGKGTWESNPYVFVYEFELIR